MSSNNKSLILGHLTRDPELRFTNSGAGVCNFGIATNRKYGAGEDDEEKLFLDVVVFGKQAEPCSEYLTKGRQVFVVGRLRTRSWETNDGERRSKTELVAEEVTFVGRKGGDDDSRSEDIPI